VDAATARYIRRMVTDGRIGEQPVFRTPMDAEVEKFSIDSELADLVSETAKQNGRTDAPTPLLRYIFKHESGGAHASSFGGREFVKLGIDWNNPGDRSVFNERETSGRQPSFSRGWGMTQLTFFNVPVPLLPASSPEGAEADGKAVFLMRAGIPQARDGVTSAVPLVIASGRENARSGVALYLDKFRASQEKRECTFRIRHDCASCLRNLQTGPRKLDGGGKPLTKGGMKFFDETQGDFDRVSVRGRLVSHRFRSLERLRQLVQSGDHQLAKSVAELSELDTLEFPCSWLTAVTLYAGAGEIAWYYALDAVSSFQG
jgi:hypothetical protein